MGNKVAPLVFTGAMISAAGSFRRGWPVRFAPAANSVAGLISAAGANSAAGAAVVAGTIIVGGANSAAGSDLGGGSKTVGAFVGGREDFCSFSSWARRSFSNRKIAAKPPVLGLTLLLIVRLTIDFKCHFGVGSVNQIDGYALHAGEFSHLE